MKYIFTPVLRFLHQKRSNTCKMKLSIPLCPILICLSFYAIYLSNTEYAKGSQNRQKKSMIWNDSLRSHFFSQSDSWVFFFRVKLLKMKPKTHIFESDITSESFPVHWVRKLEPLLFFTLLSNRKTIEITKLFVDSSLPLDHKNFFVSFHGKKI